MTKTKLPKLSKQNYHSAEMNRAYWSASLIKNIMSCQARAVAELRGEYERPKSEALQIGSYVDAAFESDEAFQKYFVEHESEICKKDGSLRAEYVKAENMIQRAKADPVFMEYMTGKHQVIKTKTLWGVKWKAMFDVLLPGKRIVDLKTVKDFEPLYKPGEGRLNICDYWNWTMQMALYQRIEGHGLPCYIAAITKEDPADIAIIEIPQARMDAEIDYLETQIELFKGIKDGVLQPERCGACAYCRSTKRLTGPISLDYFDLLGLEG